MPYIQKVWVNGVDKVDAENMNHMEGGVGTAVATSEAALTEALKPGPPGPTGPQGVKGDQGIQGPQGVKGDTGNTGSQGPQGIQGNVGPQGTGLFIRGTVPTSSALPVTPVTVDDAWVAVDTGHVWFWDETNLPSPRWEDGGALQGAPGPQGPQGPTGATGTAGAPGATGSQGPAGTNGTPGATGPAGPGVPVGGSINQVLAKKTAADYDTQWVSGGAGGSSLTYEGAYVPATAYQDGDIVVLNGVAFICHRDTNSAPDPALWGAVGIALPATVPPDGYGVSLPASPVDGQTYTLVDSLTNPTYQWRFRYNAGSASAYKWEFVGGAPMRNEILTAEARNSNTYGDLATVGPTLTMPRAGEYVFTHAASVLELGGAAPIPLMSISLAGAAATDDDAWGSYTVANQNLSGSRTTTTKALAASAAVVCKYRAGSNTQWRFRSLLAIPVRVS